PEHLVDHHREPAGLRHRARRPAGGRAQRRRQRLEDRRTPGRALRNVARALPVSKHPLRAPARRQAHQLSPRGGAGSPLKFRGVLPQMIASAWRRIATFLGPRDEPLTFLRLIAAFALLKVAWWVFTLFTDIRAFDNWLLPRYVSAWAGTALFGL